MSKYKFRYFFDPGAQTCVWALSDSARERFGYPVDITKLPICENTWRRMLYELFDAQAQKLLIKLRSELGSEFEFIDDSGTE